MTGGPIPVLESPVVLRAWPLSLILYLLLAGLSGCSSQAASVPAHAKQIVAVSGDKRFSFLHSPSGREEATRKLLLAMAEADVKTLMAYADPDEIKAMNLTERKLALLAESYVDARKGLKSFGVTDCRAFDKRGDICTETLRSQSSDFPIEAIVYSGRSGSRSMVVHWLMRGLRQIEEERRLQGKPESQTAQVHVDTIKWLRSKLEPLGFAGFPFQSAPDEGAKGRVLVAPWDRVVKRTEEQLKESSKMRRTQ